MVIPLKSIIAIMDIDNTTVSKDTREFEDRRGGGFCRKH